MEADNDVEAEKAVARWLFSVLRRGGEPACGAGDLFPHAEPPIDIVIKVDHNHIGPFGEEGYRLLLEEAEIYEKKKLAKVLPAKERKLVLSSAGAGDEAGMRS